MYCSSALVLLSGYIIDILVDALCWTLDTILRGLPLVCMVELSRKGDFQQILLWLTINNALEFGKYFQFILQEGGEWSCSMDTVESHGTPFVRKMAEVLWHIDRQYAKLVARQAPIPKCNWMVKMTQETKAQAHILHVPFLRVHRYVTYCCCSYTMNVMNVAATVTMQNKDVSHF